MLSDPERRAVLEHVVAKIVAPVAQVEWVTPPHNWPAHAWLRAANGRACHLLASSEWQEARFEEPDCSVFIVTTNDAEADVRNALARLARVAVEYLSGRGHVEQRRGLFGPRLTLVLDPDEGEWRIGKRSATIPRLAG